MPRSPSARCIHDLGIAPAPIVFSGVLVGCVLDRALRVAKKVGARAAALERCLRDLGSIRAGTDRRSMGSERLAEIRQSSPRERSCGSMPETRGLPAVL
jgi:hypothetical protein